MPRFVVVVGGVRTAQALRREGHDGPVVLVGAEQHLPYDKSPLSKQFLAGAWDLDRVSLLTGAQAETARSELRLGVAAAALDVAEGCVVLVDGSRIPYDVVVLATGAAARPSPWQPESGVYVVRGLDDGHRLQDALASSDGPVVVVDGGFIGAEVAGTAHAAGRYVTVVDPQNPPIARVLGDEVGALFGAVHERHGVDTGFGIGVRDITGQAGDLQGTLTDGEVLPAEIVVGGVGATPNVDWLTSSGLLIENGVVCDEFDQAANVAHNITRPDAPCSYVPDEFVWSDQYDWKIQFIGRPRAGVGHEVLGDAEGSPPRFAALFHDASGRFIGAATVNWPKALSTCRRLLSTRADIDEVRDLFAALPVAKPTAATAPS